MAQSFSPDSEISSIISKLWDLDNNKCFPGDDYELNLQGYVTSTRDTSRDHADEALFSWVNDEGIRGRKTYKAFIALLDNYQMEVGKAEVVTQEERQETTAFIDAIMETDVMIEAHKVLAERKKAPSDVTQFKKKLFEIWFKLYRRSRESSGNDSCSFEHVFVGESRGDELIGLHNWIQFFMQEKAGNIDYHGYFRRETVKDDSIIRLLAVQFDWRGVKAKPMCSVFIGSSPEFEIAAYTVCLLLDRDGKLDIQLGEYEVEMTVHSFGWEHKLGTAYIAAARMEHYGKSYSRKKY